MEATVSVSVWEGVMADKNQVTVSAPGKLMLFGEHAVVYGHPCIVTAVNQRLYVTVRKNGKNIFRLDAPGVGLTAYSKTISDLGKKESPKEVQFVERVYQRFLEAYPQLEGIDVVTRCDFSTKFGFGSSSAVTVAFAKALTSLYGYDLTEKELFDLSYRAVIDVQGVGSGFDIASAIWGGTIYYVPPAKVVRMIDIDSIPLMVGYTGVKADTPTLVRMVQQMKMEEPERIGAIFEKMSKITDLAEKAIGQREWLEVGRLMKDNQQLLREVQVSSVELEKLIAAAQEGGSFGAKLSGAGGGDCMIAIAEPNQQPGVEVNIGSAGGEVLRVHLGAEGARYESDV